MRKLTVRGRYLAWDTGEPFFYLADTAWELFHRLDRDDAALYLRTRADQGFNAVQAVALAEHEGVTVPNAYGRLPLLFRDGMPDPAQPDTEGPYSYWDHVDHIVDTAADLGLFIVLLPTWGDKWNLKWGKGPVIFDPENAFTYGKWIGARYTARWNIIWMLGGDRPIETPEQRAIIDRMAEGIRAADPDHLITFHPAGHCRSTDFLNDAPYIDFHTAQSGHAVEKSYISDSMMLEMAAASAKPYMDSESRYEDHPACFDPSTGYFWNADDARQNAYWNLMAGVCGQTYGNHCVWSMNTEPGDYFPFSWKDVLRHPGAEQFRHLKELRLSRDYFSLRPAPELLYQNEEGMGRMAAARGSGYAYVYTPLGLPVHIDLDPFSGAKRLRASWFDPRTGSTEAFAVLPPSGRTVLVPPSQGKGHDHVLILEEV